MNLIGVINVLGALLVFNAGCMTLSLGFSLYYGESDTKAFIISVVISLLVGVLLWLTTRKSAYELRVRDGFAVVTLGWFSLSLFGALPFWVSGHIPSFTDAFFETMSGYTTTGATILPEIASLPHGLLFWRSFTHWLGGMGIIVLSLAILPMLGVGGMQLFKAEVPGPQPDKLSPRLRETAKILWGVYLAISIAETILLMFGGMSLFDALCHTFGTVATGGFSTKNASVGEYNSVYIDLVITVFMFMAGVNFALHYRALRGKIGEYWRDPEFMFYAGVTVVLTLVLMVDLRLTVYDNLGSALRYGSFQVVAITTTTGYGTADFEQWSVTSQIILFALMFVGGCAGSTGGSMKVMRVLVAVRHGANEFKRLLHPHAVLPLKVGNRMVSADVVTNVLAFITLYVFVFVLGSVIMASLGLDLISAIASVAATLGNVGPGLGTVGPTDNYSHIPDVGKWLLSFFMLLGRLELYTVLIIFSRSFWKR